MSELTSTVPESTVSVVVITRNRPQMVHDCLEHLGQQTHPAEEIIVVDSSTSEDTQAVLDNFSDVVRLRIPDGRNNMPHARNLGIAHARGEIIAFLDDDSMAHRDWLHSMLLAYDSPSIGGVGGRVIDVYEDTRTTSSDEEIGIVRADGLLRANFGLDPGRRVKVDHFRGCNMSFRKTILERVGGFDKNYTGGNTLEETDMCVRVSQAGYTLIFEPRAVIDHLSVRWHALKKRPPDLLELFHGTKNYAYFFFKNYGIRPITLRHICGGLALLRLRTLITDPSLLTVKLAVALVPGIVAGGLTSLMTSRRR